MVKKKFAPKSAHLLGMINNGLINDSNYKQKAVSLDMSETNGYLKNIDNNTAKRQGYRPDGSLAWEYKGRTKYIYG